MTTIKLNDLGIEVIKFQILLNFYMRPCPYLMPTGYFDQRTHKAVIAFQKTNKLTADGVIGPKTRALLGLKPTSASNKAPFHLVKPWLNIAEAEKGIQEDSRPEKHHARIVEFHQTTTYKATDDETPWCSSFVNWVMIQSGRQGTNKAAAKSWLGWGVSVATPERGDVVVVRDKAAKQGTGYHVGFYISSSPAQITILGGNQGGGRIHGGMVKESQYPLNAYEVVGYRRPPANQTATYLKFGNVKGNVTADSYKDQIAVATVDFDVNRNVSMETGKLSNRESSKPTLSQIAITKLADNSVASLFKEALSGSAGREAVLSFVRTGNKM